MWLEKEKTAVKPYLSIFPVGLVCFARYCGKMYSRHLFPYYESTVFQQQKFPSFEKKLRIVL